MTTMPRTGYGRKAADLNDVSTSGRQKVFNEAHCRMCLRHKRVRPLTRHHLVPLAWFLQRHQVNGETVYVQPLGVRQIRNANANIIPLCRPCHDLVDHRDREIRKAARRELRRSLWQPEIAFAIAVRDLHWLDAHYPRISGGEIHQREDVLALSIVPAPKTKREKRKERYGPPVPFARDKSDAWRVDAIPVSGKALARDRNMVIKDGESDGDRKLSRRFTPSIRDIPSSTEILHGS